MRTTPAYDWVQHDNGSFSGRCDCGHEAGPYPTSGMLASEMGRHAGVLVPLEPSPCPVIASEEFAAALAAA